MELKWLSSLTHIQTKHDSEAAGVEGNGRKYAVTHTSLQQSSHSQCCGHKGTESKQHHRNY